MRAIIIGHFVCGVIAAAVGLWSIDEDDRRWDDCFAAALVIMLGYLSLAITIWVAWMKRATRPGRLSRLDKPGGV